MQPHSFGYWLKRRRKALDLTQAELASQVGCSAAAIRKLEAEERRPSVQIVERLAEIFNIPQNEQVTFLRFARGDWTLTPSESIEDSPWRTSTISPRSNLPASPTALIGREQEIAKLSEYLFNPSIRLITLIGPPGIGKTRLSIQAARVTLPNFSDGVFFVALAPLEDPNLLAPTIVQTLGFVERESKSPVERLKDGIGGKHILLVLDNLEHLIEGVAPLVSELLTSCPHLQILTTSREALRILGEWLYSVPTLDVPKEGSSIDMETVSEFPALTLFAERARAVRLDFDLNADNIETVATICTQLDGLPLAIELIAARIRLMSPESLLDRLNDQFTLFADGMRALPARQKTLHNAIAWSYNLLSDEEQKLFAYLSVFSGGFTFEAAEAIFSRIVTDKSVTDLITSLLDKSLLQRVLDRETRGEPRFTMLVTIQQFAQERLRRIEKEAETRDWHLAYFRELAEQARPHIQSTQQLAWLDRLETDLDNIHAALIWAENGGSVQAGLHLVADLSYFWIYRSNIKQSRIYVEKLLANPKAKEDIQAHAKGLLIAGLLAYFSGDRVTARTHLEASESLWQQLGEAGKNGLIETRDFLIDLDFSTDHDLALVRRRYEDYLKFCQEVGDRWHIAQAIYEIAWVAEREGDLAAAQRGYESSIVMFRAIGDDIRASGIIVVDLGPMVFRAGNYAKAHTLLEEGLTAKRQTRHQLYLSVPLYMLGVIAVREGDYARAKEWYAECLKFEQDIGETGHFAECLIGFASIATAKNHVERAVRLLGAAEVQIQIDARGGLREDFDQAERERLAKLLRTQLEEATFATNWAEGRAMTMEQAVAFALEKNDG
jgi:predicted ATPase/DNA-binding XRE family transcriptional regulator